jgi:hypothetical protein
MDVVLPPPVSPKHAVSIHAEVSKSKIERLGGKCFDEWASACTLGVPWSLVQRMLGTLRE